MVWPTLPSQEWARGDAWAPSAEETEKISSWPQDGTKSTLDLSRAPDVILTTQHMHWWKGCLPDGQLMETALQSSLEGMKKVRSLRLFCRRPRRVSPILQDWFSGRNGTKPSLPQGSPPFFGWTNEGESSLSTACMEGTKETPPHFPGGAGGKSALRMKMVWACECTGIVNTKSMWSPW